MNRSNRLKAAQFCGKTANLATLFIGVNKWSASKSDGVTVLISRKDIQHNNITENFT